MSDHQPSPPQDSALPSVPQQEPGTMDAEVHVKEESPSLPSPTASATPHSVAPSSSPTRQRRTTVAQRRALLRDDILTGEVEPYRVFCQRCSKWIRLSSLIEYSLSNWKTHRQRHEPVDESPRALRRTPSKPNFSPNSRVATTERQIVLLNDAQVKTFATGHVHCAACKTVVALEGEVDYDLTRWTAHKQTCIPKTPAPITPRAVPPRSASSTRSLVSAGRSARSPTPVGAGTGESGSQSTETTVVPDSSPPAVKFGVKRGREEEVEEEVAREERPTVRPRTETEKPPKGSMSGWWARPFKEFARGFREGLGS